MHPCKHAVCSVKRSPRTSYLAHCNVSRSVVTCRVHFLSHCLLTCRVVISHGIFFSHVTLSSHISRRLLTCHVVFIVTYVFSCHGLRQVILSHVTLPSLSRMSSHMSRYIITCHVFFSHVTLYYQMSRYLTCHVCFIKCPVIISHTTSPSISRHLCATRCHFPTAYVMRHAIFLTVTLMSDCRIERAWRA